MSKGFLTNLLSLPSQSPFEVSNIGEEILNKFLSHFSDLDTIINSNDFTQKNTPQWYKLLQDLGTSFSYLYLFHEHLIRNHQYFKKNPEEIKYVSFFMDLNASQLKNNFFKESPGSHYPDTVLSTKNLKDIYSLGIRLLDDLPIKEMKQRLYLFYHKIFVTYDYIYHRDENDNGFIGAFTKFTNKRTQYIDGIRPIERLLQLIINGTIKTTSDYRKNSFFIIQDVIRAQVRYKTDTQNQDKYQNNFFKYYLQHYYKDKPLEPISYIFAHKLWKINKLIEHRFEQKDESSFDNLFLEKIKIYLEQQIEIGKNYYDKYNISTFSLNSYETDFEFSKFVFSDILHRNIDKPIPDIDETINITYEKKGKTELNKNAVTNALNKIHSNGSSKFNKILNTGTKEELKNLIYALDNIVKTKSELVGLYRSGALMAHCINILNGIDKKVFLFTSFPYMGLHPMSCNIRKKYNNFTIVDESNKTGFTNIISMIYTSREGQQKKFQTIALTNFKSFLKLKYEDSFFQFSSDFISTIEKDNNQTLQNFSEKVYHKYDIEDYFTQIKNSPLLNDSFEKLQKIIFKTIKLERMTILKKEEYFDVTRFLSQTNLLFLTAVYFWLKIKQDKYYKYFLHAPSDEGRLIAEAIALVAKFIESDQEYNFVFNSKNTDDNTIKAFIDLTIDSGTNFKHSMKKDIANSDKSDDDIFNYYDKIAVILLNKDSNLKHYNDIINIIKY